MPYRLVMMVMGIKIVVKAVNMRIISFIRLDRESWYASRKFPIRSRKVSNISWIFTAFS
ncbi:hypothetical protein D3C87_1900060 [compost metagenome]